MVLDAGGLIALDRNDRRIVTMLARAHSVGARVTVPASALAQVIRRPATQARLSRMVRQPTTDVVALDSADAIVVGRLLASSGTKDVVDAHVVVCARRTRQTVWTSDTDEILGLDPTLSVQPV